MTNKRTEFQGIVNGIVGDHLESSKNPLSMQMNLYFDGHALDLNTPILTQTHSPLTNKVVILIHGLTNTESIWNIADLDNENANQTIDTYGERLRQTYRYTPLYLRYNTGLSIHQNGKQLSEMLETLCKHYPIAIEDITLIGFSMGGLLARIAQSDTDKTWLRKLRNCFYIGTPHEGAPLERFGHFTSKVFGFFPQPYLNRWEEWINIRSEGIKDLRRGLANTEIQFNSEIQHCFISGGIFHSKQRFLDKTIGDILVQQSSANPSSKPEHSVSAHFDQLDHISLAHSDVVYEQINAWFKEFKPDIDTVEYRPKHAKTITSNDTLSEKVLAAGSAELALDLFKQTVDTVDVMHHSISDETYRVLDQIPLTKAISKNIKQGHHTISKGIFDTLRFSGRQLKNQLNKQKLKN